MRGHIAKKGGRYYAVVYEGVNRTTGRGRHRWYAERRRQALFRSRLRRRR